MGCFITITHTKKVLSWVLGHQTLKAWGNGGVAVANIRGGPFNSRVTALVWKVLLIYTWQQISGRPAIWRWQENSSSNRLLLWEGTKIAGCSTTYPTEVLFKMTHFGFRVASFLISGDGALLFHFSLSKIVGFHSFPDGGTHEET